ncbi:hepcidin-1 [Scleropages formosus]|uniref:Hepcidin-like n=1 Tax=Scleropages formosus TaxID=113540 RepID=A0A8C9W7Y1_SCLFO|nr:hepcidin [Scleropages formosus]
MKFLSIIAVILCACALLSAASPVSEMPMQETREGDIQEDKQWITEAAEEVNPLVLLRSKRQSHLSLCRYCCNCCKNKGCGYCCKF